MPFLGTIINFLAVLIFGTLGSLIKKSIPKRISDAIMSGIAICVIYIGISGALEEAPEVSENFFFSPSLVKILIMIISVGLGTLIGELINFDMLIGKLGATLENRLAKLSKSAKNDGSFAKGFVSCSLLFCVGAMSINGALADALGNPDILLAKTVIDSIAVFLMSTTLGIGCAFSAFFVLAYQGIISIFGLFLSSAVSEATLAYMSQVGSLLIILVGTNVLGITKIKTANMAPAIFIPIALVPLIELFC